MTERKRISGVYNHGSAIVTSAIWVACLCITVVVGALVILD